MFVEAPKHILVPVDGSKNSGEAAEYAAMWQRIFGSRITLLYAATVPLPHISHDSTLFVDAVDDVQTAGKKMLERVQEMYFDPTAEVEIRVAEGLPRDVLINFIYDSDCDLVVMGSQGIGSPLRSMVLGSVAKEVLTHSEKPVLILHSQSK